MIRTDAEVAPGFTNDMNTSPGYSFDPMDEVEVKSDALLNVSGVSMRFGKLTAVRNVSLKLGGGELLGLIGPNGAGKTTLLRAIAGLHAPTRGTIQLMGQLVGPGQPVLQHLGFTPDTPAFYEELTVGKFLTFISMGYGLPAHETRERIDFWLDKVWLSEKRDTKIKTLSRGMRQRVGIARTLLPNPQVILLDEPAAGLDPAGRKQFRQLLCDLREQGKALIVSSHILADLEDYCTHVGIMSAGEMVRYGSVRDVTASHQGGRCRYTVHLAEHHAEASSLLAAVTGLEGLETKEKVFKFRYDNDPAEAAKLLASLIQRGLPVAAFAPDGTDLEDIYMKANVGRVD